LSMTNFQAGMGPLLPTPGLSTTPILMGQGGTPSSWTLMWRKIQVMKRCLLCVFRFWAGFVADEVSAGEHANLGVCSWLFFVIALLMMGMPRNSPVEWRVVVEPPLVDALLEVGVQDVVLSR